MTPDETPAQDAMADALGRLAARVAHDLNNICQTLVVNLDLAREAMEPGHPASEDLDQALAATERAVALSARLRHIAPRPPLDCSPVDLASALRDLAPALQAAAGPRVRLTIHVDTTLPPVLARPDALRDILVPLCANAGEAMPEGGTLSLDARPAGEGRARITLRDTGPGIHPAVRARLFEPFCTTKAGIKGAGLGLCLARATARQIGGTLRCIDGDGEGATFEVLLRRT